MGFVVVASVKALAKFSSEFVRVSAMARCYRKGRPRVCAIAARLAAGCSLARGVRKPVVPFQHLPDEPLVLLVDADRPGEQVIAARIVALLGNPRRVAQILD